MNQDDLARRIAQRLNDDLDSISPAVRDRLQAARASALQRTRGKASFGGELGSLMGRAGSRAVLARAAAAAAFAAVAAAAVVAWQLNNHHESVEVETALLADELPIHAYTDPGFDTWLRHSSHERP